MQVIVSISDQQGITLDILLSPQPEDGKNPTTPHCSAAAAAAAGL
ncbi:MAG: hypothetical protein J07HQW1_02914 [Haloquadratum walsbyi J07HQW1]|uniref:Uncharacterized protein n=1 Tax=Haloquadratum walsbyi J07HQW1 TaxID=1238424 RepID=U1N852_9EURY|nr:MAG: hypothetical protein J07HQW1_02914 [Haloquadratum walsbyi J07HQW1]